MGGRASLYIRVPHGRPPALMEAAAAQLDVMRKGTLMLALRVGLALVLVSATSTDAFACTCVGPSTARGALGVSSAVFAGTVVRMDSLPRSLGPELPGLPEPNLAVTFRVDDWWKGAVRRSAVVRTNDDAGACGYSFTLRSEYLVYAVSDSTGRLHTSICTRTASRVDAVADIAALGPPLPDRHGLLLVLAASVLAAALLWWMLRGGKRLRVRSA